MKGPKNAKPFTELLNRGPLASHELPYLPNREQRRDGIRKFHPRTATPSGSSKHGGPRTKTPVYYIHNKHSPDSVIKKWISENEKTVKSVGEKSIHWRVCEYGEEWKRASRDILGPFREPHHGHGDGSTDIEECPMCGTSDFNRSLAYHLQECPEA